MRRWALRWLLCDLALVVALAIAPGDPLANAHPAVRRCGGYDTEEDHAR